MSLSYKFVVIDWNTLFKSVFNRNFYLPADKLVLKIYSSGHNLPGSDESGIGIPHPGRFDLKVYTLQRASIDSHYGRYENNWDEKNGNGVLRGDYYVYFCRFWVAPPGLTYLYDKLSVILFDEDIFYRPYGPTDFFFVGQFEILSALGRRADPGVPK